jgi:hypothetical protein
MLAARPVEAQLAVSPAKVEIGSPESSQQLLITQPMAGNRKADVTRDVSFLVQPGELAKIDSRGVVRPLSEGRGTILVRYEKQTVSVPLEVIGLKSPHPVSFRNEITPILTKAGCNSGGCHGKAEGQGGFKLSIFGFAPQVDFQALAWEGKARRLSTTIPERSLLFLKGSARIPHGGGRKIEPGSYRDRRLLRWIKEGAQFETASDGPGRIVGIEIEPERRSLLTNRSQQIRVTAVDAAGRRFCVTTEAEYESNATSIADVDHDGLIQASDIPGEAAMLVRYLGHVAVSRITIPRLDVEFGRPPENNFIDGLVWDKLQRLGIEPSGPANDSAFLRRVFIDTIGTLPTVAETRSFLADKRPDKRTRLIDQLLARDEYVDYWTMQWLDILRADQLKITPQGAVAMQRWLKRHFAENRPFDRLARDLVTVQGNTAAEGPGSFYKILPKPDEAARSISQLLLGVRIECAQCHHHPSERWTQADYVGFAGFFTGVKLKALPNKLQAVVSQGGKDLPHPRTGELVAARALGAEPADFTNVSDRRQILVEWLTSKDNPFFAKAIANRLWAHYLGRGLIEPIDDIRDTNPATNEALMQALADHMRKVNFDVKAFTRTLLQSQVYQLSAGTNASNENDQQNFSHAAYKALPAEVLLDAISQSTGVAEKFNGWPAGYRAIQVWDNRMPSYFFRIFGRPVRASVCECERSNEPSIAQALHLLNAPEIGAKIGRRSGRVRGLAASDRSPTEIIGELYLSTLSRLPTDKEEQLMLQAFEGAETDRRAAAEDVLWALLNSKEFVFNH